MCYSKANAGTETQAIFIEATDLVMEVCVILRPKPTIQNTILNCDIHLYQMCSNVGGCYVLIMA